MKKLDEFFGLKDAASTSQPQRSNPIQPSTHECNGVKYDPVLLLQVFRKNIRSLH